MFKTFLCYSVVTVLAPSVEESLDPVQQFKTVTLRKVVGLRCGVHGKTPTVDFHGLTLRDIRISMRCCCRQLSALANRAIVQPTTSGS
jgi:hypothetical protein